MKFNLEILGITLLWLSGLSAGYWLRFLVGIIRTYINKKEEAKSKRIGIIERENSRLRTEKGVLTRRVLFLESILNEELTKN